MINMISRCFGMPIFQFQNFWVEKKISERLHATNIWSSRKFPSNSWPSDPGSQWDDWSLNWIWDEIDFFIHLELNASYHDLWRYYHYLSYFTIYYIILYHYLSWSTIVYLYVLMSLMYTYVTSKGKKWANSSSAEASLSQPAAASGPFHNAKKTSRCAVGCLAIWLNGFPWFPMVFRGLVVRCFSLIKHGKSTKKIKKGDTESKFSRPSAQPIPPRRSRFQRHNDPGAQRTVLGSWCGQQSGHAMRWKEKENSQKFGEIGWNWRYRSLNPIKSHQIPDPVRSLLGCAPEISAAFDPPGRAQARLPTLPIDLGIVFQIPAGPQCNTCKVLLCAASECAKLVYNYIYNMVRRC